MRTPGTGRTAGRFGRRTERASGYALVLMTDRRCPHGHGLSEDTSQTARHSQPVSFCQTCNTLYYPDGTEAPHLFELEEAVDQLIAARRSRGAKRCRPADRGRPVLRTSPDPWKSVSRLVEPDQDFVSPQNSHWLMMAPKPVRWREGCLEGTSRASLGGTSKLHRLRVHSRVPAAQTSSCVLRFRESQPTS